MAWIEKRHQQFRVYERTVDDKKTYEPFATRADAQLFIAFAAAKGWDTAVAAVRRPADVIAPGKLSVRGGRPAPDASEPAPTSPAPLPSRMALPPPAELRPAGLRVGDFVRLHIDGLVGIEAETQSGYQSFVRDDIDPFFGDLDAGFVIDKPIRTPTAPAHFP